MKIILFSLLVLISVKVNSYNILGVFHFLGKSHFNVFEPLVKGLAKKGHNVTVISHFPQETKIANYEDISLKSSNTAATFTFAFDSFGQSFFDRNYGLLHLMRLGQLSCETDLLAPQLLKFLAEDRKFDIILIEYFHNDCFLGIVNKYKVPFIGILSSPMLNWHNVRVGNPGNPSYMPVPNMLSYDKMSFFERVESTVMATLVDVLYNYYYVPIYNQPAAKKVFGNDLPPLLNVASNVSALFVNSHFSARGARPFVPGIIEIGGIHISNSKILPKVRFLINVPNYVILLSSFCFITIILVLLK